MAFFAVGFLAVTSFAVDFFGTGFLAIAFFVVDFFAEGFFAVFFGVFFGFAADFFGFLTTGFFTFGRTPILYDEDPLPISLAILRTPTATPLVRASFNETRTFATSLFTL